MDGLVGTYVTVDKSRRSGIGYLEELVLDLFLAPVNELCYLFLQFHHMLVLGRMRLIERRYPDSDILKVSVDFEEFSPKRLRESLPP